MNKRGGCNTKSQGARRGRLLKFGGQTEEKEKSVKRSIARTFTGYSIQPSTAVNKLP